MRRLDVEEVLGKVPSPDVKEGMYLIEILFAIGPTRGEMPLDEGALEPWERRRGIQLEPWQAELIVHMSQEYMRQQHLSREMSAICPWPYGAKMWMHVTSQKHAQAKSKEPPKEQDNNGSRKRHRNPATR